ncbi:DUF3597 domain-containing protein [Pseudomonas fluorescens]|uniref:DUF3597 domain-containing protein n=1 Tax=Pseudomonas fluorescens TaxID=294 RepID=UPI001241A695|nr:DUF3597 domain-containing protein [Pseudomonas fluorescens]VVM47801.1 hypothetical protein PS639_00622 [Pseudomonas fluorescens]
MSLFSTILEKLGIGKHAASPAEAAPTAPTAGAAPVTPQTPAPTPTAAISEVDVASKLEALASQQGGQLNWRTSIVDLLKLLNIDSSLAARKELAAELHYTGSTDDSAAMNIWLHSAVMKKLAENGWKVPADLLN